MTKNSNFQFYILKKFILPLAMVPYIFSIIMTTLIAFDINNHSETMPMSYGLRSLLLLNSISILSIIIFIIIFLIKKTNKLKDDKEKISLLEENKSDIRKIFYPLLVITCLPSLFVIGNILLDSSEIKSIPCNIYLKDFTQSKKVGFTYYLYFDCKNKSEYKIIVNQERWNKIKQGDRISILAQSGAFGLERIKNIKY